MKSCSQFCCTIHMDEGYMKRNGEAHFPPSHGGKLPEILDYLYLTNHSVKQFSLSQ